MASRMKSVCHTNPATPSQSLIKMICYPEELSFNSKQSTWGIKQEKRHRNYISSFKNIVTLIFVLQIVG